MSRFFDPAFSALAPYTPGEQPRDGAEWVKLNTNESPYPPSPAVLAAVGWQEMADLRLYCDPECRGLREAIGNFYGLAPDQVFPGNGSDEVLAFCFHGLCPNGAVFPDVTYGFYPVFARMFGRAYREIPLREDYTLQVADYAGAKETVFLANPNAPTGLCLPLTDIAALAAQDRDRLVVVDEAYINFGGESAVALLGEFDNLLVVQTFSKSRQLAGGRLGFALGNPRLIADLNTLKFSFNPYSVSRLTQIAGTAAINDRDYFETTRRAIMLNRRETAAGLRALGFSLLDSRANFLFAAPPDRDGAGYAAALRQRGILVRHFGGPRTRDFVRITIGTQEQMERLLSETEAIVKGR